MPKWIMISYNNTSYLRTVCEIVKGNLRGEFYLTLKQCNSKEVKPRSLLFINGTLYEQKAKIQGFNEAAKGY